MAIHRTDHAAIRVRDLGEALEWYEGVLGLTVLSRSTERALLACRGDAVDLTIQGGGTGLVNFAFGVDSADDLTHYATRLKAQGVSSERLDPEDRPGTDQVLAFQLPSGHNMELAVGSNGRRAGVTETVSDGTFRPTDMDHVNIIGEVDPKDMSQFLTQALDFKQSLALTIGGNWFGSWLRATKLDHDIAYLRAANPAHRLHHVAFAVEDGNHYFRLADRLVETGNRFEYGPGRHMGTPKSTTGFGTNLFAYAFDPSGNRNEFSSGMNEYPDGASFIGEIRPEEIPEIMNGYGLNMPVSFVTVAT
jgi:catechol 2,3-dioxygenase